MPKKPIRQKRTINTNETKPFILFNDDEIDLKAKFIWDNNNHIQQVTLYLHNLLNTPKYKICKLERCKNTYPGYDYLIIHLSTDTSSDDSESKPYNFVDKVKIKDANDSFMFLFKESALDCEDIKYSCEFAGGTPDSKDGSIIIGN